MLTRKKHANRTIIIKLKFNFGFYKIKIYVNPIIYSEYSEKYN